MKKLLTLLLALVFVFTFASCTKPNDNTEDLASKIIAGLKSEITEEIKDELNLENQTNSNTQNFNESKVQTPVAPNTQSSTQSTQTGTENKTLLTKDEAKAIALKHAQLKENEVFDLEVELDREGGTVLYEINFETREFEFEYDIDATSGKIIKEHKEFND